MRKANSHISTVIILAGLCLVAYTPVAAVLSGASITPAAEPTNPGGPELLVSFQKNDRPAEAAADACEFGCLCDSLADHIEWDGSRSEPQLRNGTQLDNLRRLGRDYQLKGVMYGSRYPGLAEEVGRYLTGAVGDDGGPVSAEQRAKWVAAYRTLAKSSHYAADFLTWKHGPFKHD